MFVSFAFTAYCCSRPPELTPFHACGQWNLIPAAPNLLAGRVVPGYPYDRRSVFMQRSELRLRAMKNGRRQLRFWALMLAAAGLLCDGAQCVAAAPGSLADTNKSVAAGTA